MRFDLFTDLARASAIWTMEHLTPANRTYIRDLPRVPEWWRLPGFGARLTAGRGRIRDKHEGGVGSF